MSESSPGTGGPAGTPPPTGDSRDDARRRAEEARERARTAWAEWRDSRRAAREAAREARQATREAWRSGAYPRGVIGVGWPACGTPVTPRIVFGVLFIVLGVLWTLDNFGLLDSSRVLAWTPLVLVVFGILKLTGRGVRRNPTWGAIWIVVGTLALAGNLGLLSVGIGQLWPLLLVALGVLFIRRATYGPVFLGGRVGRRGPEPGVGAFAGREGVHVGEGEVRAADDAADRIELFSIWSHVDRRVTSQRLRHVELAAVMGGIRLDLRGARAAPEGAVVDLAVVWGGVDIVVPAGWQVVNEATVLIGGITDSTVPGTSASGDRLVLRGAVVMGGVELKSV